MHPVNKILCKKKYIYIYIYFFFFYFFILCILFSKGRWFDETNIKIVVAGLVGLIAVLLFFCFGSN